MDHGYLEGWLAALCGHSDPMSAHVRREERALGEVVGNMRPLTIFPLLGKLGEPCMLLLLSELTGQRTVDSLPTEYSVSDRVWGTEFGDRV